MVAPVFPAAYVDESGFHKPDYEDIRSWMSAVFRYIYGEDIYIEPDSQDGQLIAILSAAFDDLSALCLQTYGAFSPLTARGAGLSSVVKINGIRRLVASSSTVDLRIVGQAGTTIRDGIATDEVGGQWLLPPVVTIPVAGEITITAVAREAGSILAQAGTITTIGTPTRGWQSVTNPSAAVPGQPVEPDAQLRQRQTGSTALPSLTVFEGTMGAVESITGVERLRGYENDTGATDANGIPGHSIALVVQGGDADLIAQAIARKKTPGTGTYGTTTITVVDQYGVARDISFFRPTSAVIRVAVSVTAMAGYTTAIENSIRQSIADWINALQIGEDVEFAEMYVPANLNGAEERRTYRITGMTIAKNAGPPGTADLPIDFNEAATAAVSDVIVTPS